MSDECCHAYVATVKNKPTGDTVQQCEHCNEVLGFANPAEQLPRHWFDHTPRDAPYFTTAGDVLNGATPRDPIDTDRYIHICGNCQHWMGAVHSRYFESLTAPYEGEQGFVGALKESLCPNCGAANFRDTSLVMAHSDAKWVEKEGVNLTRYIHNRADMVFWRAKMWTPGYGEAEDIEMPMHDIGNYSARCPCCGYAVRYGGREFDFHHWDYENDVGCQLCRECHSHIHRGLRASEQAELSDGWKRDAVRRLYKLSISHGLHFGRGHQLIQRFNLRVTPDLLVYINGVVDDE